MVCYARAIRVIIKFLDGFKTFLFGGRGLNAADTPHKAPIFSTLKMKVPNVVP